MSDDDKTDDAPTQAPTVGRDSFGRAAADAPEGFITLRNADTGGIAYFPDAPGVIEHHEALGWTRDQPTEDDARKSSAPKKRAAKPATPTDTPESDQ